MTKGHGSKYETRKEKLIQGLLTQRTLEEAAEFAGLSVSTARRWMKLPEFQRDYAAAKRRMFSQSSGRLMTLCSPAVSTLGKTLVDPESRPATRARAAQQILAFARMAIEIE